MITCPRCRTGVVALEHCIEDDLSRKWASCWACGWTRPEDQIIIHEDGTIIDKYPQEVLLEKEKPRKRPPLHRKLGI